MASSSDAAKRAKAIAGGQEILGYVKRDLSGVEAGQVLTFLYDAKSPGKKGTNLFDLNPTIVLLGAKKSKTGVPLIIGANTNYLESVIDKGKVVLRMRTGTKLPSKLLEKMVHAYRLDRVASSFYRALDGAADPAILMSEPLFTYVRGI